MVKTRLARALGATKAAAAYRWLATSLLDRLAGLPNVQLRFAPADAAREVRPWLRPGWRADPQGSGDLGRRLARAFAENFATGDRRVVIIGSDCPAVDRADIRQAWRALETHDLVLGPAHDGGYWLIGLRAPQPGLFRQMPWSTEQVLAETLARARAAKLRACLLRQLADVDTEADWNWLLADGITRPAGL
jgi:hypothetical protein